MTDYTVGVPKSNYRYDIDGLRGIAVMSVIINHMYYWILPGGYLGVDMFFVISGFVMRLIALSQVCLNVVSSPC